MTDNYDKQPLGEEPPPPYPYTGPKQPGYVPTADPRYGQPGMPQFQPNAPGAYTVPGTTHHVGGTQVIVVQGGSAEPCPNCQRIGTLMPFASCWYIVVIVFMVIDFGLLGLLGLLCIPKPKRCSSCGYMSPDKPYILGFVGLLILLIIPIVIVIVYFAVFASAFNSVQYG